MTKEFSQTFQVNLPLSATIPRLSSEEFLTEVVKISDALTFNIEVKNSFPKYLAKISRKLSMAEIPAVAKFASTITIAEERSWQIVDDKNATGEYLAKTLEQPVKLMGSMNATERTTGQTEIKFDLKIVCSIPFIGSMVESQIALYLRKVIELELSQLAD